MSAKHFHVLAHAWLFVLFSQLHSVHATGFDHTGEVSTVDAENSLVTELVTSLGSHGGKRIAEFEASLNQTFRSLPKHEDGHLGHQAIRYVLHRLFVKRHGWYIKGLEPNGDTYHAKSNTSLQDWVPSYLLGKLEDRLGNRGVNLRELAALAAALEDLVNKEADDRLEAAYAVHELPTKGRISKKQAEEVLGTYMMVYLLGGKLSAGSKQDLEMKKKRFAAKYTGWSEADAWLHKIEDQRLHKIKDSEGVDLQTMDEIAEEIGAHYSEFNDQECRSLKTTMLSMQGRSRQAGRVRLADFYNMSLYSHWKFTETPDYLRALGALDESDGLAKASVIIPNYLASRPNCLEASSLYSMCCRDECEDLLGHLEEQIAAPTAKPERIVQLVSNLPSDTVSAPRKLPKALLRRLDEIAGTTHGEVNIHGRLFAQWMHHAYPRECPYPHPAGHTMPQTPDEWMHETGQSSTASDEEMRKHVEGDMHVEGAFESGEEPELPWSGHEELLVVTAKEVKRSQAAAAAVSGARQEKGSWIAYFLFWLPVTTCFIAMGMWFGTPKKTTRILRQWGIELPLELALATKHSYPERACVSFIAAAYTIGLLDWLVNVPCMLLGGLAMFLLMRFQSVALPRFSPIGKCAPAFHKEVDKMV